MRHKKLMLLNKEQGNICVDIFKEIIKKHTFVTAYTAVDGNITHANNFIIYFQSV